MKRTCAYLLVGALVLQTTVAFAQNGPEGTSAGNPPAADSASGMQEVEQEMEQRRTEVQERVEQRTEEAQAQLEQKREEVQNRIEERKVEMQENLEERKAEMEQKRAEIKQRLTQKRQELITAYAERATKRLHAALDRLSGIASRIESRIEKLDAEKFQTAVAKTNIEMARMKIAELNTTIDTTLADVQSALTSEDPQTAFENVRTAMRGIVENIRNVHALLVEATVSIRAQATEETAEDVDGTPAETEAESE